MRVFLFVGIVITSEHNFSRPKMISTLEPFYPESHLIQHLCPQGTHIYQINLNVWDLISQYAVHFTSTSTPAGYYVVVLLNYAAANMNV